MTEVRGPAVAAYLDRLDLPHDLPPTLETLTAVHRRHLDRFAWTNLEIMLGRPPAVDPVDCLTQVGRLGRSGYCLHQNAVLELVLRDLGFAVTRRHGHVWTTAQTGAGLNHLALDVSGLPDAASPGGRWWADVGLGDGFLDPVPLVVGEHRQGPFRYVLSHVDDRGWSFRHDARGSFTGVEVGDLPVDQGVVDAAHAELSAPGTGHFARLLVAERRLPDEAVVLRGITLGTQADASTLTSYDDWRAALTGPLALPLDDLADEELRDLHARMLVGHRAWDEAGRP